MFALLLFFPAILNGRVIAWDGKSISVSISTERLRRIELPEMLRSAFLSRSDIAVEKEDRSLYIRALAPEIEDTLFVVGESGTAYEINISTSDIQIKLASSPYS
jgi:ribosomal protein L28